MSSSISLISFVSMVFSKFEFIQDLWCLIALKSWMIITKYAIFSLFYFLVKKFVHVRMWMRLNFIFFYILSYCYQYVSLSFFNHKFTYLGNYMKNVEIRWQTKLRANIQTRCCWCGWCRKICDHNTIHSSKYFLWPIGASTRIYVGVVNVYLDVCTMFVYIRYYIYVYILYDIYYTYITYLYIY